MQRWRAVASGVLAVGATLAGPGVAAGTTVTAGATCDTNSCTMTVSTSQTVTSTTITAGAAACAACTSGYCLHPTLGGTTPTSFPCSPGFFCASATTASQTQAACPAGYFCVAAQTSGSANACPAGFFCPASLGVAPAFPAATVTGGILVGSTTLTVTAVASGTLLVADNGPAQGVGVYALDAPADRTAPAARGYSRLKGLVVHGYFTSERVQKDVLKTQIMPGHFNGAADMPTKGAGRDE
jgi:hypothetical protein